MGLIKLVKNLESSLDDLALSVDELYKKILFLKNGEERDKLLVEFGKISAAREAHYESTDRLIEEIDKKVTIK